jgi:ribosomal-protein-alanine N-acetyltransferase
MTKRSLPKNKTKFPPDVRSADIRWLVTVYHKKEHIMAIHIEMLMEKHLDDVARLEQVCFSQPWTRAQLQEELSNNLARVFVAVEDDGSVLGYGGLHYVLDEAEVTNIAVFPEARRKGAARMILDAMDSFCTAGGMAFLTLEVRVSNEAAIALYRGAGLQQVGLRKRFYSRPTEDALLLTKYYHT